MGEVTAGHSSRFYPIEHSAGFGLVFAVYLPDVNTPYLTRKVFN
jgi:hypothetical protein